MMFTERIINGKVLIAITLAVVGSICAWGGEQTEQSSEDRINAYVSLIEGGVTGWSYFRHLDRVVRAFSIEDVPAITKYMDDHDEEKEALRRYNIPWHILMLSEKRNLRRSMLLAILERKKGRDALWSFSENLAEYCIPDDFTSPCKPYLLEGFFAMEQAGEIHKAVIRVIGLANLREALPILERTEAKEWERTGHSLPVPELDQIEVEYFRREYSLSWECLLVRARWGDKSAMDKALDVVASLSDEFDRQSKAYDLMMGTARKEAIEYLTQFLYSDTQWDVVDGFPPIERSCAHKTSAMLSTMIPELPFGDGVEACRKWMKEHEKDYRITVRTRHLAEMQKFNEESEKRQKESQGKDK